MWTKIKPHVPWNIIEFFGYVFSFMLVSELLFDGSRDSYTAMLAGCALFIGIQTRRKLEKGEYK